MEKIIINAESLVFGRVANIAAQQAILGNEVAVINSEKTIVSGSKEVAFKKFRKWVDMRGKGNPEKGPQYSRMPDKILREAIRKMLPKTQRGTKILARVKVFIGLPVEFREKKFFEKISDAKPKQLKNFVELEEISRLLGAKF